MGSGDLVFRWRKSSHSGGNGACIELGLPDLPDVVWRKSSLSGGNGQCVELASVGAVRDSKNPDGPRLHADVSLLVGAVKAGRFRS